jgi:cytochrome c biogenesis protein
MRFAISLLTLICVASVIGTVLKQHEPLGNYINQFGPFWAEVFARASLYNVYSAWWFLTILGFLVTSTSLCVARNTPKIFADLKSYKENIREQSLKAFGHRAEAELGESPEAAARRLGSLLATGGWKVKLQQRETSAGTGWMLAAKAGSVNKLGYIAAHSAIVLVCLGGLLDGDLIVRAQMLFNGKTPYTGGGMVADVAKEHRLSDRNPTFRGNLLVAEGTQSDTAILSQADGILLQELPFAVELKKFVVEYYSTGMPKLFASDIVIHDKETGEKIPARVEVNHPASHRGIEIYQSSFDDGGSTVHFKAIPMQAKTKTFDLQGVIGGVSQLVRGAAPGSEQLTVEYTGLRVINVENFAAEGLSGADVRKVDLRTSIDASLGAANKSTNKKDLRNVGPSVSYKLRDAAGQAREFNNYMLPVDMGEGVPVFLLGMRESPSEPLRYLRVPADATGSMDDFMRMRYALLDPVLRDKAVKRYAAKAVDARNPELAKQLGASAARALSLFAGDGGAGGARPAAGLQTVADFIEANVPESERNKAGEVLIRILNGALYELAQITREDAGLSALVADERTQMFMTQAVLALSEAPLYPAPVALQLTDFTQVQASVFQVARAPGKTVVYLGCALLILGVFAMLYIRERRLWIWFSPVEGRDATAQPATHATMALSTNRKTMDGDREFDQLKARLLGVTS